MPQTPPSPSAPGDRRSALKPVLSVLLLMGIPLAGLAGGYYMKATGQLPPLGPRPVGPLPPAGVGLPVTNRLGERFTDADADLVADPPADPKRRADPDRLVLAVPTVGELAEDVMPTGDAANGGAATHPTDRGWQPLADHLARAIGKPVQLAPAAAEPTFKDPVRALRDGAAHLAIVPPGLVPTAVNACGFVPVGRLPGEGGKGWTRMALVVPAASPVRSPPALRGKQLTFTDPSSAAGFKAAVDVLRSDFGLRPVRDLTWTFSGGHAQSLQAVRAGAADAAAVTTDALARAVRAGELSADDVRVIHESAEAEPLPTAAVGHAHDLAADLARRVREAILSFDWKGTGLEPRLGAAATRFVPVDYRRDWALVRRLDDALGAAHVAD